MLKKDFKRCNFKKLKDLWYLISLSKYAYLFQYKIDRLFLYNPHHKYMSWFGEVTYCEPHSLRVEHMGKLPYMG